MASTANCQTGPLGSDAPPPLPAADHAGRARDVEVQARRERRPREHVAVHHGGRQAVVGGRPVPGRLPGVA
eukprot:6938225-Alexandrium_andersonii.AAC.1